MKRCDEGTQDDAKETGDDVDQFVRRLSFDESYVTAAATTAVCDVGGGVGTVVYCVYDAVLVRLRYL